MKTLLLWFPTNKKKNVSELFVASNSLGNPTPHTVALHKQTVLKQQ